MIRPGTCIEEQCLTASVPMFLSNARNHSAIAWQPNKSQQVLAVLGYRVPQSLASANDALPSPEIETQRSLPLGTTRGGEKSEKTKDHHRSSQVITDHHRSEERDAGTNVWTAWNPRPRSSWAVFVSMFFEGNSMLVHLAMAQDVIEN